MEIPLASRPDHDLPVPKVLSQSGQNSHKIAASPRVLVEACFLKGRAFQQAGTRSKTAGTPEIGEPFRNLSLVSSALRSDNDRFYPGQGFTLRTSVQLFHVEMSFILRMRL